MPPVDGRRRPVFVVLGVSARAVLGVSPVVGGGTVSRVRAVLAVSGRLPGLHRAVRVGDAGHARNGLTRPRARTFLGGLVARLRLPAGLTGRDPRAEQDRGESVPSCPPRHHAISLPSTREAMSRAIWPERADSSVRTFCFSAWSERFPSSTILATSARASARICASSRCPSARSFSRSSAAVRRTASSSASYRCQSSPARSSSRRAEDLGPFRAPLALLEQLQQRIEQQRFHDDDENREDDHLREERHVEVEVHPAFAGGGPSEKRGRRVGGEERLVIGWKRSST